MIRQDEPQTAGGAAAAGAPSGRDEARPRSSPALLSDHWRLVVQRALELGARLLVVLALERDL